MKTRITLLAVAIMFISLQAFSEGAVAPVPPKGEPGKPIMNITPGVKSTMMAAGAISKLDMVNDADSWLYTGQLPRAYKMLNLTDEQVKSIQAIMAEARNAWQDVQKKIQEEFQATKDHTVFQNMQTKIEEIKKTYQTRVDEVLTQEQKDLLVKLQAILKERQDKISELYQEVNNKVQELRVSYDEKLAGILTPEQLKQLDDLMKPLAPAPHGSVGQPEINRAAPQNPTGGDVVF